MTTTDVMGSQPFWIAHYTPQARQRVLAVIPGPEYAVPRSPLSPACMDVVPLFRGFQDDAVWWVQEIDAIADRLAWPEHLKWSFAAERLRDAARAWKLREGHWHSTWASWSGSISADFGDWQQTYHDRFMQMSARRQGPVETVVSYVYEKLYLLKCLNRGRPSPVTKSTSSMAWLTHSMLQSWRGSRRI